MFLQGAETEVDSLVGIRFHPRDEEIILLLKMKRRDPRFSVRTIKEIDFYSFEPWELPLHSDIQSDEEVWYFFCEPYYKYAESKRVHRRTKEGYWKKTGDGSKIKPRYSTEVIGTKKILTFRRYDAAAKKAKTEWVIHEIAVDYDPDYEKDFVVCRLERKRETKKPGVVSTERKRDKKVGVSTKRKRDNKVGVSTKRKRGNKVGASTSDEDQSSQILTNRNCVAENEDLVSYRNPVAENTVLVSEVQQARDHRDHVAENIVENSVEAEARQLAEFNPQGDGYNGQSDASVSALQSPVCPEHESSYSNGSSCGSGSLNSEFDGERVDGQFNSRRDFQNKYSPNKTGQTTPDFLSSKGVYMEYGSDMDSEAFMEMVNMQFQY